MEKERIGEIKRTTSILCAQSKDTVLKIEGLSLLNSLCFFPIFTQNQHSNNKYWQMWAKCHQKFHDKIED